MTSDALDPAFDKVKFDRQMRLMTPAARTYLIVFTPRSGSTWLTQTLGETGLHGRPQEYIKESRVPEMTRRMNAHDNASLLDMLLRKRKTDNGVFWMKVTSTHIASFGEKLFFDCFPPETAIYLLWRKNIVAQAISLFRAVETRHFHSLHGAVAPEPDYDAAKIRGWVDHIVDIENGNCRMLAERRYRPTVLSYEEIVEDRERTVALFATLLQPAQEPPVPHDATKDLTKIGDGWNVEIEARFASRHAAYLRATEQRRAMLTYPGVVA